MLAPIREDEASVERFNATLQKILASFVSEKQDDWDVYLPYALASYRFSPNATTKESPFFVTYGRDPNLPIDITLGLPPTKDSEIDDKSTILNNINSIIDRVRNNIDAEQERYKKQGPSQPHNYQVGDLVLLYTPAFDVGTTKKFALPWRGPYRIEKLDGNLNLDIINIRNTQDRQLVHVSRVKRFYRPDEYDDELGKEDDVAEVASILDDRVGDKGQRQYLVRWTGFKKRNDSWVDEGEIEASELLATYIHRKNLTSRGSSSPKGGAVKNGPRDTKRANRKRRRNKANSQNARL